jgi:hypothetical protein
MGLKTAYATVGFEGNGSLERSSALVMAVGVEPTRQLPDMFIFFGALAFLRLTLSAMPSPHPRTVNTQTKVLDTNHGRILCIADIRGRLSALNDLAREVNAKAIIHTGDFGFFGMCLSFLFPFHSHSPPRGQQSRQNQ